MKHYQISCCQRLFKLLAVWESVVVHGQGAGFAHSVAVGVDELKQVVHLTFTVDTEIVVQ